jgi:hypothetical protein
LRIRSRTLESLSVYADGQVTLVDRDEAEVLRGLRVNQGFFETLGVKVLLGRGFLDEEDRAQHSPMIILTHDLWKGRFEADPNIIGRILSLSGEAYRVIGVLPSGFHSLRMTNPVEIPQFFALAGEGNDGRVIARQWGGLCEGPRSRRVAWVSAAPTFHRGQDRTSGHQQPVHFPNVFRV